MKLALTLPDRLGPRRRNQRGVTLIIVLILLVVIGVSSTVAMRSSLFGDMVSKNIRSQNLALQAAEIALRYCEAQIAANAAGFKVFSLNNSSITTEWLNSANWSAANINTVPTSYLGTLINYATPPECIVRRMSYEEAYGDADLPADAVKPEDRGMSPEYLFFFRITARGYSPEFARDANGNPIAGSQVWLQSTIRGVL